MERRYMCHYNSGNGHGHFHFYSKHRAGSNANQEDARQAMRLQYGKISKGWTITQIYRDDTL